MGVTLRKKVLRKGRISLYIDYCYQSKRKKQYLGIILERPDSSEIRKDNQRKMLLAQRIRAKKELEFLASIYEFNAPGDDFKEMLNDKTDISLDFFHLMKEFLNQYSKKDNKMVDATLSHLHQFHKKNKLPIEQITKKNLYSFYEPFLFSHCIFYYIYSNKRTSFKKIYYLCIIFRLIDIRTKFYYLIKL